ncbi:hypothetical protein BEP19_05115 [Ammoniphilus oxalaticus]|uniref:Sigma-w pathway protein ysdB n=1 Tax=Ammoniphilus oxalaticus TaxID=66863 RepID=A0A419SIN2_9BACL|nr:sigma-w pathway protein ysdB [Ammoniphilus oxalaticus]RKD23812.1 hypothetical protein BEP19_05115 [Ammoniphilus oxalaticus]
MILIIRILLLILLILGIYWCFTFFLHPYRKINRAVEQKRTIMMDDKGNVHRNILLVYRGVLFEGEKYMGTTEEAFQIVKIHVWPRRHEELVGLQREDFEEIRSMIHAAYPHAEISWKSPIRELLHNSE